MILWIKYSPLLHCSLDQDMFLPRLAETSLYVQDGEVNKSSAHAFIKLVNSRQSTSFPAIAYYAIFHRSIRYSDGRYERDFQPPSSLVRRFTAGGFVPNFANHDRPKVQILILSRVITL